MDEIHKCSDSEYYTLSSEHFRFYWIQPCEDKGWLLAVVSALINIRFPLALRHYLGSTWFSCSSRLHTTGQVFVQFLYLINLYRPLKRSCKFGFYFVSLIMIRQLHLLPSIQANKVPTFCRTQRECPISSSFSSFLSRIWSGARVWL
jgi:hypothetical protein